MTGTKLAVLGSPISHSLSPTLHSAAYSCLGLDWTFLAVDVDRASFSSFITSLSSDYRGFAVTMPLKHDAYSLAETHDFLSTVTRSTNTLACSWESGSLSMTSYNTDVFGIVNALMDAGCEDVRHVAIIGSGATAASGIAAAAQLGAEHVSLISRNANQVELSQIAEAVGVAINFYSVGSYENLEPSDVVLSTVPGNVELSLSAIPRREQSFLLDVAYNPWPSQRAVEWEKQGGIAVSGLEMLVRQALIQVRVFVLGSPEAELDHEQDVFAAMRASLSHRQ
jgi:shikimate dehydrogenase